MVQKRYQINWEPFPGASYPVSLMLESEMVALALKGGSVKETSARLEIGKLVREAVTLTDPTLHLQPVGALFFYLDCSASRPTPMAARTRQSHFAAASSVSASSYWSRKSVSFV